MNTSKIVPFSPNGSPRSATEIVGSFDGLRALVLGDAMLDLYVEGNVTRICKEGPVPVVDWSGERSAPGGAANVAANLAALGAEVRLAGLTGSDHAGAELRRAVEAAGVDTGGLIEDASCTTLQKLRIVSRGQYLVRLDSGTTSGGAGRARRRLLQSLHEMIDGCDLVVISDYAYGAVDDRIIDWLVNARQFRGFVLAVDAKYPMRYAGAHVSILTPSFAEACDAVGARPVESPFGFLDRAVAVASALRERVEAEYLAVTLAGDGVLLANKQGAISHIPSRPMAVAQDVGAGDTFVSAVGLALAAHAAPNQAIEIGIEAALLALTQERTSVVDQQELLRRVNLISRANDLTVAAIAPLVDSARLRGQSVVFTNGVFDILHVGHVDLLRRAKELGDLLIVGINSDASTRRLKGPTRPINSERDRLALVSALESVDAAVLFEDDTPEQLIRALRPNIHVKGGDYRPADLPEARAVAEVGGRIEILPFVEGRSTTRLIESIQAGRTTRLAGVRS